VINADVHARVVGGKHVPMISASKYPPAFGISVLVDDSPGVAAEGALRGSAVVCVPDRNEGWVDAVRVGITQAP